MLATVVTTSYQHRQHRADVETIWNDLWSYNLIFRPIALRHLKFQFRKSVLSQVRNQGPFGQLANTNEKVKWNV